MSERMKLPRRQCKDVAMTNFNLFDHKESIK